MGYVYIIVEIDGEGNEKHKIGISKNDPELRVKQLSTGNSNEIRLINQYESENYKVIEKILHRRYHVNRTLALNEWFDISTEDVMNFITDCKKNDETINFLKENNPFMK